ncbi:hypothetical protein B0H17DRAFT_1331845 [Mycena rosella]|uniref:Uncharacterized protein n=1 Tax=Mycena rosella TaxID=1033263 RepID=A0AAD7DEE1_MYCRO|nr:hypothetical protein B0H17DRAFT_1331845 [Mycena rosella]
MYPTSPTSSATSSPTSSVGHYLKHSSTSSSERSSDSLYRTPTRASSIFTQSSSDDSAKFRYGGRGGAGSRARSHVPPMPPLPLNDDLERVTIANPPESQSSNFRSKWLNRVASSDGVAPDHPTPAPLIPTIALRRGTISIPKPLILRDTPSHADPGIQTPPLSAVSTLATGTDSEFPRTPRSPYFYFDDPFDNLPSASESPLPSPSAPSGSMSRSLRRLASRTQQLFSKDIFLKAPPVPPTPSSPTFQYPMPPSPSSLMSHTAPPLPSSPTPPASSSRTSVVTSEWYDPPEYAGPPEYARPASLLELKPEPEPEPEPEPAPPPPVVAQPESDHQAFVVDLPVSGGRTRSASEATVKSKSTGRRKKRREPRTHGEWNRGEMGEVIVGLRMLK